MPPKEDVEATKARLLAEAQEQARQEYAQQHRYDPVSGGDLGIMQQPGSGWTPQSTPQKPPSIQRTPVQRRLIHGTPVRSAQRGFAQRAFGTPSTRDVGKTPDEIAEDNWIRQQAAFEARGRQLRADLVRLDAVHADLVQQLQDNQRKEDREFFAGTGFGSGPSPHKNTDKTYIKF